MLHPMENGSDVRLTVTEDSEALHMAIFIPHMEPGQLYLHGFHSSLKDL